MGCCGNKRRKFVDNMHAINKQEKDIPNGFYTNRDNQPDKMFEYTGGASLSIVGTASGNTYSFKFKGHKLLIKYSDSYALMAEKDLRISLKK